MTIAIQRPRARAVNWGTLLPEVRWSEIDGKGRFLDNIFVERLWRSLKYECVYLHAWETGPEARAGVGKWMEFYNRKRPHSALGGKPPAVVYWQRTKETKPDQQEQKLA